MNELRIERALPHAWVRVRAVRLRALADAPSAFGTTTAEAMAEPDTFWQAQLADPGTAFFLATRAGKDVGLIRGAPIDDRPHCAGLYSMWVDPPQRGRGRGEALIAAVVAWARDQGYQRLLLEVGDANTFAEALYERLGFTPTGRRGTLPPPRQDQCEHERELLL